MEERVVKICASLSMILMLLVCSSFFYLPQLHVYEEELRRQYTEEAAIRERLTMMTGLEILQYNNLVSERNDEEVVFQEQLRMGLPEDMDPHQVTISDNYLLQTIEIMIPGADGEYLLNYPMVGSPDHIVSLTYESADGNGYLDIVTDRVFEVSPRFEEGYLYLDFLDPHEVYEKVVVVDAGHGGAMPGATRQGVCEKDLDLQITEQLRQIFTENGDKNIGVYYTRLDDSNPSFEERVGLANKAGADVFISIHNNAASSGKNTSGTTVLYDEDKSGEDLGSKRLAEICSEEVCKATGNVNQGLMDGNEVYIIRNADVPVALIEVGFMTNEEELKNLENPVYQRKAAEGIYQAIQRAFEEGF